MAEVHQPEESVQPEPLSVSVNRCLTAFQVCLSKASHLHPRVLSMIEDQVASLYTWARSIGVFAPQRASLDHRLRLAPEVHGVVNALLESLEYRIGNGTESLNTSPATDETQDPEKPDSVLGEALKNIATEINNLHKVSNIIRRASKDSHALKTKNFSIRGEEGNDVEPFLLQIFKSYIADRFPNISDVLKGRLATTMLLRRKHILYRRYRLRHGTQIAASSTEQEVSVTLPRNTHNGQLSIRKESNPKARVKPTAASNILSATTLDQGKFQKLSAAVSAISESRTVAFKTHESLVFPPAPGFAQRRKYEKRRHDAAENGLSNADDNCERANDEMFNEAGMKNLSSVNCPYCSQVLTVQELLDEEKWRLHLKDDLEPYVCIFETCDRPEELYAHSEQWIKHLHDHKKTWRCPSHRDAGPFDSRESYIKHLQDTHATSLSSTQLATLATRNARKPLRLFESCPLCGQHESSMQSRIEEHITGHLRSLALKSLPAYYEEDEGNESSDVESGSISRALSRSTVKHVWETDQSQDAHDPRNSPGSSLKFEIRTEDFNYSWLDEWKEAPSAEDHPPLDGIVPFLRHEDDDILRNWEKEEKERLSARFELQPPREDDQSDVRNEMTRRTSRVERDNDGEAATRWLNSKGPMSEQLQDYDAGDSTTQSPRTVGESEPVWARANRSQGEAQAVREHLKARFDGHNSAISPSKRSRAGYVGVFSSLTTEPGTSSPPEDPQRRTDSPVQPPDQQGLPTYPGDFATNTDSRSRHDYASPGQPSFAQSSPATQRKAIETYSQFLQHQQGAQVGNSQATNVSGPHNQGSPKQQQTTEGDMINTYYNAGDIASTAVAHPGGLGRRFLNVEPPPEKPSYLPDGRRQGFRITCRCCWERKIRCSGYQRSGRKCTNCARMNLECVFRPSDIPSATPESHPANLPPVSGQVVDSFPVYDLMQKDLEAYLKKLFPEYPVEVDRGPETYLMRLPRNLTEDERKAIQHLRPLSYF